MEYHDFCRNALYLLNQEKNMHSNQINSNSNTVPNNSTTPSQPNGS